MGGLTPLPLPPGSSDPNTQNAVPDVNRSTEEKVLGGIGGVLAGGTRQDFNTTPLAQQLARSHQTRLANARRNYENAASLAGALSMGEIDPATSQPTGINPETQQPMSADERNHYLLMLHGPDGKSGAWGDYAKAAGVDPDAKKKLEQHKGLLDFATQKGHAAFQQLIGAHQQAGQAAGKPPSSLPTPPPSPTDIPAAAPAGGAGTPTGGGAAAGAASSASSGGPPPLPSPGAANPQPAAGGATAQPASPGTQTSGYDKDAQLAMPMFRQNLAMYQEAKKLGIETKAKTLAEIQGEVEGYRQWKAANPDGTPSDYLQQRGKIMPAAYMRQQVMERGVLGSDYPSIPTATGEPADPKGRYDVVNDPLRGRYLIPAGASTESTLAGIGQKESSKKLTDIKIAQAPEELDLKRQRIKQANNQLGIALKRYGLSRLEVGANYDPSLLTPEEQQQMDLPVDSKGQAIPLHSPNAPTGQTKSTAQTAQVVDGLVGSTLDLLKNPKVQAELGPIKGRLNEIYIGKIGADDLGITDPDTAAAITALRTLGSFDASGALKVHFGARGGGAQYDKFKNLMDTGKMDAPTLISSLGALHRVLGPEGYGGEVKTTRGKLTPPPSTTPERPKGVPADAQWDSQRRVWFK